MNTQNPMISSYHSKIRSTQNKRVTFHFCLGHGLKGTKVLFPLEYAQPEFFQDRRGFVELGTLINISSKTCERKTLLEKILEFFLQDTVKTTLRIKDLIQRWTQSERFFQGRFFWFFKKDRGGTMCLSLSLAILCLQKRYCCSAFLY